MISVVIPVLNEEESAPLLAQKLFDVLNKQNTDFEIIFVDDGSTDQTLNRLLNLKDKKIRLVELSRRYGQTAAISAGIDSAQGEIVIIMDGDLQHDPEDIPRFLEKIYEGFDIVSGWRKVRTDNFLIRKLPSYFANKAMRLVSGVEVQDFGSTYKAYRSDILQKIELFGELHRFIPVLASKVGAKICEIPISVHPRKLGKSK
ncbi:MAG: glycosyltransferase family 2 protein, partial [bacterium]|nr:glycosyltransferase family 2 protein [bacterium]